MAGPTIVEIHRDGARPRLTMRSSLLAVRLLGRESNSARVGLVGTSALLLGGDRVRIEVHVGTGCALEIVEIAATVAYNADGADSSWRVTATVDDGGLLLWHGEPLIIANGANVVRRLEMSLRESAMAFLSDTLVMGRSGERGGAVRALTSVTHDGHPLLVEEFDLSGENRDTVLRGRRIVDSVTLVGCRAPEESAVVGRRFELHGPGTVGRELLADLASSPMPARARAWAKHARAQHATVQA